MTNRHRKLRLNWFLQVLILLFALPGMITAVRAEESGMTDPAAVIAAVSHDRLQDAMNKITRERAELFTANEEIFSAAEEYKAALQTGQTAFQYYALLDISFRDAQERLLTALSSKLPAAEAAAFSVISRLAGNPGYCCPRGNAQIPLYAAAVSCNGALKAVMLFSLNSHHAMENCFLPVLEALSFDTEALMTSLFPGCTSLSVPDLSDTGQANILAQMKLAAGTEESAQVLAVSLAKQIAARAVPEDPLIGYMPEEVRSRALSFRVFSEEPSRIVCLSGDTLAVPEEFKESLGEYASSFSDQDILDLMLSYFPGIIAGQSGDYEIAAQSIMREETSAALSGIGDTVYLLVYGDDTDDPAICYVSILLNENGCFDLTALPMSGGPVTTRFLQIAETGTYPWSLGTRGF